MIICFEEKDREKIESNGIYIIEFKRFIYKLWDSVKEPLEIISNAIYKAVKCFYDGITKFIDDVKLLIEEFHDFKHYPTSARYKIVKFLSNYTKMSKYEAWTITRYTWLARSCI